ncbi:PLC-like phosphodiesterase [Coprinellus micaceus]|uniref:PLC-like phosphodiesterase n=1 Tax=Coprinellus micaceus TaxID=71717 RepID=A0A4Y7SWG0_COPMI|nr:PLC-like phosphodiesterase [Coprinellus micaceus]
MNRLALFLGVFLSIWAGLSVLAAPTSSRMVRRHERILLAERQNQEMVCNGRSELCDRKYGNVTFLGAHDSFAHSPNPFALSRTQEVPLTEQLNLGARLLQAQSHMVDGKLHFCHTSCGLFDGGLVEDYLRTVKTWMDKNPNEVITFIFTNPGNVSVSEVWKPLFEKTGMDKLAYIPPSPVMSRDDWPTLREFITGGKRLIIFLDKGADNRVNPEQEYILPQFKMVWEDPYNPTDASFPCKVDRTAGPLSPTDQLYLINHNLNFDILPFFKPGFKLPDRLNSPRTNGIYSIYSHALNCAAIMNNKNPNFVLTDFTNVGQAMAAVNFLNGFA